MLQEIPSATSNRAQLKHNEGPDLTFSEARAGPNCSTATPSHQHRVTELNNGKESGACRSRVVRNPTFSELETKPPPRSPRSSRRRRRPELPNIAFRASQADSPCGGSCCSSRPSSRSTPSAGPQNPDPNPSPTTTASCTPPQRPHPHPLPPPRRPISYGIASPALPGSLSSRGLPRTSQRSRGPPRPGGWPPRAAPDLSISSRCSGDAGLRGGSSRLPLSSKARPGEVHNWRDLTCVVVVVSSFWVLVSSEGRTGWSLPTVRCGCSSVRM